MNLLEFLMVTFSMAPRATGNADVDELLLYNYQAQRCSLCEKAPAHRHGDGVYHCDACCVADARARVAAAQGAPAS